MIGKLTGKIDFIDSGHVILDVNGVGYLVYCSSMTMNNISCAVDKQISSLLIETIIREDSITLYGFSSRQEKDWFKLLITVKGLGPKMALQILSSISLEQIHSSLVMEDKTIFTSVSGVGPKLADRIITELKDKSLLKDEVKITPNIKNKNSSEPNNNMVDAISALSNLGYNKTDAYNIVNDVLKKNGDIQVGELIKQSLKELIK